MIHSTYSIIAFDPEKKQIGGAMLTHTFEACQSVIWVQPGAGVVASQAASDPFYAFAGLEMMQLGKSAKDTLKGLVSANSNAQYNQVAMIDLRGDVAAYTGEQCIPEAGHRTGMIYSCQANIMLKNTVWDAMAEAYENSKGELVDRIMRAMEAAQREGGDIRGAQSAVIKVFKSEPPKKPWRGWIYDFRIYDADEPLTELRRLIDLKKVYKKADKAQELLDKEVIGEEKIALSMRQFNKALQEIPKESSKLQYQCFYALSLFNKGKEEEALSMLKDVFTTDPVWREVVKRVAEKYPDELYAQHLDRILSM